MYGSVQIVVEQSSLGGGGGNVRIGGKAGAFGLLDGDPEGETVGEIRGIWVWPDAAVGAGEEADEALVTDEGTGKFRGERETEEPRIRGEGA